ncbi:TonB-dependent receptor plug domain-containing protein [Luteimonas suaedae]|uniref:TonB-dependent receptor plug domain-containing protein n=1 Tax=Luteimonas suaedae TaxID=2605430 RepID=UPI0011EFE993|nr:TonB-dependent receptor [Luteimonas suaedae]
MYRRIARPNGQVSRSRTLPLPPLPRLLPTSCLAAALLAAIPAKAQERPGTAAEQPEATTLDTVQVVGSRVRGRTAAETAAPVDVISREQLERAGVQEIGQMLQVLEPSFNFSRTFVSDGTDIIRPATLRALGPDQVLVLVNGKRRHQQALVNVQQTIGRGSAGTDINAIPISAIERIEVLRDGAAAQYGSDAIAGVINIVLKNSTGVTTGSFEAGQTYEGDGTMLHGGLNTGFALGTDGFLNLTVEYRDREETNRAGPDRARTDPPRVTQRLGDADAKDAYFWLNGGLPVAAGELYWFGGLSRREGDSSGFFRSAGDNRSVPDLYPEGFLPNIITTAEDASLAAGYRAPLGEHWEWDLSVNHGRSRFEFDERNSVNVSWWYEPLDPADPTGPRYNESPVAAHTGALEFDQTTVNLDVRGPIDWGFGSEPLYLATGLEYRREGYAIEAGDPVSYTYGRTNDRSIPIFGQTGDVAQPGIQGFPGFSPNEAVDEGRHSYAAYLDAESRFGEKLLLGAAVRYEKYSDFGNTTTGKLSARFDATDTFAVRGTLASGFRAPGVQQLFYGQRSTNLNAEGELTDTLTARQDSDITRTFGIEPLKEEESISGTLGIAWKPNDRFALTVDVFRIDIDDRIIFSSNIQPESTGNDGAPCAPDNGNCPIRAILDPIGVGQVLFFTNAIDTRTEGVDVVTDFNTEAAGGILELTALLHWNRTEVTDRRSQSDILSPEALFDDTQVTLVEEGQPGNRYMLQSVYRTGDWDWTLRANYFGSVAGEGFTPGDKQKWDGQTLFDAAVGWQARDNLRFTVGANNLFDTYPDKWKSADFQDLGFLYGWETLPFGINGGYYYAKVDFRF